MLVGIISDTHSHVEYTQDAVRIFKNRGAEMVLHCGDIGSASIVDCFTDLPAHFVLGNVDWNRDELQQAIERAGHTYHGRVGRLEVAGRRILFLHGDDDRLLRESIESADADLICYGHTHKAEHHHKNGKLVVNPGAVFRSRPPSVALVELDSMRVETVPI
jgi:putative phosphoesterase